MHFPNRHIVGRIESKGRVTSVKKAKRALCHFQCSQQGEFGVAILLIENQNEPRRKNVLLDAAISTDTNTFPRSVSDQAARMLSRYDDPILTQVLCEVPSYGAQYTALLQNSRRFTLSEKIKNYVEILGQHESPMKAQAAEELLITIGSTARNSIKQLRDQMIASPKSKKLGSIENTVLSRCSRILRNYDIEKDSK